MRKILTALAAALTFGSAIAATATPANADPYRHGRYGDGGYGYRYYDDGRHHRHRDNDAGIAVAAGVAGLALGAALASNSGNRSYYGGRGYYDRGHWRTFYGPLSTIQGGRLGRLRPPDSCQPRSR